MNETQMGEEQLAPEWTRLVGASRLTGLKVDALRDYIKAGRLPASLVAGSYYIKISDLRAFMESCRVQPPGKAS